jgi:GxxExxY protein
MRPQHLNTLSRHAIGAAIAVHRELGPGLEEEDYEMALSKELSASGIAHRCQVPLPVVYKSVRLDAGYRLDVLIEESLILEVKSVELIHPVHEAQVLTYLRLAERQLGLLLNFNVQVLRQGIRRKVLGLEEQGVDLTPKTTDASTQPFPSGGEYDELSHRVIGAAIEVHRHLGPGLLRSAYEECLCYELSVRNLAFERRKPVAVRFREVELPKPVEVEVVVAGELPLMILSAAEITPLLEACFLGQLKIGGWRSGLLLNFSEKRLAAGIRRVVNPRKNY